MIRQILLLVSFFVVGFFFSFLRKKVIGGVKREIFDRKKFIKIFEIFNPIEWIKSLKEIGILDARKWVIYGVIIGTIYGYGWFKGKKETPVKIDIGYGRSARIRLNGNYLHIKKDGSAFIEDKHGKTIKQVNVKDVPALRKKLKPIGLQFKPVFVAGASTGDSSGGVEVGAGISFLRYWKWQAEAFVTSNPAIYLGTSYSITDNAGIGLGVGKGLDLGDNRVILYGRFNF